MNLRSNHGDASSAGLSAVFTYRHCDWFERSRMLEIRFATYV
uniref:Uncharacterized protein n=1 Tax=Anguilla anguilla TaxID=7936 RepID=A0A0E9UH93_ANGAN